LPGSSVQPRNVASAYPICLIRIAGEHDDVFIAGDEHVLA
jgi:hypothetical protein